MYIILEIYRVKKNWNTKNNYNTSHTNLHRYLRNGSPTRQSEVTTAVNIICFIRKQRNYTAKDGAEREPIAAETHPFVIEWESQDSAGNGLVRYLTG